MNEPKGHRIETIEQLRAVIGEKNPMVAVKVWSALEENSIAFIKRSPFLLLATADAAGHQQVSPKGDAPGFVEVENETSILIPDRNGNKLIFGLTNILANPEVGVIFLVPGTGETLRVNGRAELTDDPAILRRLSLRGKPAQLAIRVAIRECFFHCAKAFIRAGLWRPETWPARARISFGKMMAPKLGLPARAADQIDQAIEEDYRNNL